MGIKLQIDDSAVQAELQSLISGMVAGYQEPLKESADLIAGNVKENFLLRGGFDRDEWQPLAPATIRGRESKVKHGLTLRAQIDSPEIQTGQMMDAATDTTGTQHGSGFHIDSHSVTVGIDTDVITYAEEAMGLIPGNTPIRNPIGLTAQTENDVLQAFEADLNQRLNHN